MEGKEDKMVSVLRERASSGDATTYNIVKYLS